MEDSIITTLVSFIPPCSQWNGYFDGFQFAHGADESLSLGDPSLRHGGEKLLRPELCLKHISTGQITRSHDVAHRQFFQFSFPSRPERRFQRFIRKGAAIVVKVIADIVIFVGMVAMDIVNAAMGIALNRPIRWKYDLCVHHVMHRRLIAPIIVIVPVMIGRVAVMRPIPHRSRLFAHATIALEIIRLRWNVGRSVVLFDLGVHVVVVRSSVYRAAIDAAVPVAVSSASVFGIRSIPSHLGHLLLQTQNDQSLTQLLQVLLPK
mmetsp:Transcript_1867/g.4311  ORF Transcript_1867/g.4311 Transcript_1867/m.4311 type:complete len:263 (+) Transcript_1867:795-1583(+)